MKSNSQTIKDLAQLAQSESEQKELTQLANLAELESWKRSQNALIAQLKNELSSIKGDLVSQREISDKWQKLVETRLVSLSRYSLLWRFVRWIKEMKG